MCDLASPEILTPVIGTPLNKVRWIAQLPRMESHRHLCVLIFSTRWCAAESFVVTLFSECHLQRQRHPCPGCECVSA